MIPSTMERKARSEAVYQRGVVIDSQPLQNRLGVPISISKGSGD